MDKQHTVLMVSNHSNFSFQEWDNLATIMSEGGKGHDREGGKLELWER